MADTDRRDLERLINLTDAALAITLTLMMLEIRLPPSAGEMSDSALVTALVGLLPQVYAYALSFVVVGLFWIGHRQKFRHLLRGIRSSSGSTSPSCWCSGWCRSSPNSSPKAAGGLRPSPMPR